jgi:hypothetical protein
MHKFIGFIALATLLIFTACKKEESTTPIQEFTGTWDTKESYMLGTSTVTDEYSFSISADPINDQRIIMLGFGNLPNAPVPANMSGRNFTVTPYAITINGEPGTVEAAGSVNKDDLNYTIEFKSAGFNQTRTGVAKKR